MLQVFGKGYVIEHCISLFQEEQDTEAYRIYTTEMLSCIARSLGAQINVKYIDIIHPKEEKSADEIIDHIKKGLA